MKHDDMTDMGGAPDFFVTILYNIVYSKRLMESHQLQQEVNLFLVSLEKTIFPS